MALQDCINRLDTMFKNPGENIPVAINVFNRNEYGTTKGLKRLKQIVSGDRA